MKLANNYLDTIFDINIDFVNTLVVEQPKFFTECVTDLYALLKKENTRFILSEKNSTMELGEKVEIMTDFINIDFNNKKLANGLIKGFVRGITEHSTDFAEYFAQGYRLLGALGMELLPSVELECDVEYSAFIKLFKPSLDCKSCEILHRLISYIDALIEFNNTKFLILVNIKSYLTIEEFDEFFKHARYMQLPIFCIESHLSYRISDEKIVNIDCDLCEIVL